MKVVFLGILHEVEVWLFNMNMGLMELKPENPSKSCQTGPLLLTVKDRSFVVTKIDCIRPKHDA